MITMIKMNYEGDAANDVDDDNDANDKYVGDDDNDDKQVI